MAADVNTEIQRTGYVTDTAEQPRPYVQAAARQFSPQHQTLTERLPDKIETLRE